jgi:nickel/cobalt transporter (NiCoT) family protein
MAPDKNLRTRELSVIAVALLLNLLAASGMLCMGGIGAAGLGAGWIAYLLGVRHAFDADHIAAIDNVTRRLRAAGQRPAGVGLFFSLGHSAVVLLLTAAAILAARHVRPLLPALTAWGSLIGAVVSAGFLTVIGLANLRFLAELLRKNRVGAGVQLGGLNALARRTDSSWKMFPLGVLFGLSFDTASEVALLAISVTAAQDASIPLAAVLLIPLLFTAGMALMDTMESLLMLRVYDWAIADHDRTIRLNTVTTAVSVCLALAVALKQWLDIGSYSAVKLPAIDPSAIGALATALLLGLGVSAWLRRRQFPTAHQ